MSKTIDDKVVSLEFDNSDFERNVSKSMSTLDKLKEKLNFSNSTDSLDELEKAAKNCDMSSLEGSANKVSVAFSALESVAMGALMRIGSQAVSTAEQMISSMSGIDNMITGWNKYAEQTTSIQTILSAVSSKINEATGEAYNTSDIMDVVDRLSWYSDETSYSLSQMTDAIGSFTSAGIDLNVAAKAAEGISNACADAGVNASSAAHAFAGFSKAIGQGHVTLSLWNNQLKTSGITNSENFKQQILDTAEAEGYLTKVSEGLYQTTSKTSKALQNVSIADFTSALTDSEWLTSDVLLKTFDKYTSGMDELYETVQKTGDTTSSVLSEMRSELEASGEEIPLWLKSFANAQEAVTFAQAIDSVKEAVASGWSTSFTTMFGALDEAKKTWTTLANDLYEIFAEDGNSRNEILSGAFDSKWDVFTKEITDSGLSIEDLEEQFVKFGDSAGYQTQKLIDGYGSFEKLLTTGNFSDSFLLRFFESLNDVETDSISQTQSLDDKLKEFQKVYNDIWSGVYGNGSDRKKALEDIGYNYDEIQKLINAHANLKNSYELTEDEVESLTNLYSENSKYTQEQIDGFHALAEAAGDENSTLNATIKTLKDDSGRQMLADSIHNLCEAIINLKAIVGKAWSNVFTENTSTIIYNIVRSVRDFTESLANLLDENSFLENSFTALFGVLKIIEEVFTQIIRGSLSIASKIFNSLGIEVKDFSEQISDGVTSFADWLDESDIIFNTLDSIGDSLSSFIDKAKEMIDTFLNLPYVSSTINGFTTSLGNIVSKITGLDSFNLDFASIGNSIIETATNMASESKDPLNTFASNVGSFFGNITGSLASFATSFANDLGVFAKGVGFTDEAVENAQKTVQRFTSTLVGVGAGYMVLSSIKDLTSAFSSFLKPIQGLAAIGSSIAGLFNTASSYVKTLIKDHWSTSLLKVAGAVAVLAIAVGLLSQCDQKSLWSAAGALSLLMGVMALLAYAMSSFTTSVGAFKQAKTTSALLSFAASLLLIAIALKVIDGVDNWLSNVITLGICFTALIAALYILSSNEKKILEGSTTIIAIGAGLLLLAVALNKIANIKFSNFSQAMSGLAACVVGLALLIAASKLITPKSGATIIAMSLSVLAIAFALEKISDIDSDKYYNAITKLIPIVVLVGVLMVSARAAGAQATGAAAYMGSIAVAVYSLAKAINLFGEMDTNTFIKGGACVSVLMVVVSQIMKSLAKATSMMGGIKSAISMCLMMITLGATLYMAAGVILIFKDIPTADLWNAVGAIAVLEIAFGAMVALMSFAKFSAASFTSIVALCGVLISLAGSVLVLSFIDTAKLESVTTALIELMASITAIIAVLNAFGASATGIISTVVTVGAIAVLIAAIAQVVITLTQIENVESAIDILNSISIMLVSIGMLSVAISTAAELCTAVSFTGILALLAGVSLMVAAILGLIYLVNESGYDVSGFAQVGIDLGNAIGGFVGGLVGGFLGGVASGLLSDLPNIAESLSTFMTNMEPFFDKITKVPTDLSDKVESIIDVIGQFGSSSFNGSLKQIKMNDSEKESLNNFFTSISETLVNFSEKIKGKLDIESIKAAKTATEAVCEMVNAIPSSGGLIETWLTGTQDISSFTTNIEGFCDMLISISDKMANGSDGKTFSKESIESIKNAGEMMTELANTIPAMGGLQKYLNGEKSLADFGDEILKYVRCLCRVAFALDSTGFSAESLTEAKTAGEMMTELANAIPTTGFLHEVLEGKQDLGTFGSQIETYVTSLTTAADLLSESTLSSTAFDAAVACGNTMKALAVELPQSSIIGRIFGGESIDLSTFGKQIGDYCYSIVTAIAWLTDITDYPSDETLAGITSTVSTIFELAGLYTDEVNMENFGSGIANIGYKIKQFIEDLSGLEPGKCEALISSLQGLFDISQYITELNDTLNDEVFTILTIITTGIQSMNEPIMTEITTLSETIIDALKVLVETILDTLDIKEETEESGKEALRGFLSGLQDAGLLAELEAAGIHAAEIVNSAFRGALKIKSPSRVMMQNGEYVIQGLIKGINSQYTNLEKTSYNSGNAVLDPIRESIIAASELIEDEMNLNPVITPILDLSQLQYGSGLIGGMFNTNGTLALASSPYLGIQNGLSSGIVNMSNNITFEVNNANNVDRSTVKQWSSWIVDEINEQLGRQL